MSNTDAIIEPIAKPLTNRIDTFAKDVTNQIEAFFKENKKAVLICLTVVIVIILVLIRLSSNNSNKGIEAFNHNPIVKEKAAKHA